MVRIISLNFHHEAFQENLVLSTKGLGLRSCIKQKERFQ